MANQTISLIISAPVSLIMSGVSVSSHLTKTPNPSNVVAIRKAGFMLPENRLDGFVLGSLCKRGHDYQGTGKSLRRTKTKNCVECQHYRKDERKKSLELDEEKGTFLGHLCKQNHDHEMTGQSLRNRNGYCVLCMRIHALKHRKNNLEKCRQADRERRRKLYAENPEKIKQYNEAYRKSHLEVVKSRRRKYYRKNVERLQVYMKQWCLDNKERVNAGRRRYKKTLKGRAVMARQNHLRRARKRVNHFSSYSVNDLLSRRQAFNGECAYCCTVSDKLTLDHFVPIRLGGSDTIGNIVFACAHCNSSKAANDVLQWFSKQLFYSKKRWKEILKVLGKTESTYNQIPLL